MNLQTRRPPGHANRKALGYVSDILNLRGAGHSLDAIRQALEDAGLVVSISTVRREVLRGPSSSPTGSTLPQPPRLPGKTTCTTDAGREVVRPLQTVAALQGRTEAEAFMRGRSTNPLFLQEKT